MVTTKQIAGYTVAMLVPIGVIAGILGGLMNADISSNGNGSGGTSESIASDEDANMFYFQAENLGELKGMVLPTGVGTFYGIPFSQTTAGEYRWKNPRDPLLWEGVFDATRRPPACPQVCDQPSPEYICPPLDEMDEDCLSLTVYIPSRLIDKQEGKLHLNENIAFANLPVMVYIFGGAYTSGGNNLPLYDGRFIAEKGDVILVAPNYRVGPLGFLYMDFGTGDVVEGNFGIYDQIKALEWVNKHIAQFGGDPNQVTLFGQSAGAQSIAVHLVNDISKPLFKQAIMQSNPFGLPYKNVRDANKLGKTFAEFSGCSSVECMRSLTVDQILTTYTDIPYSQIMNYRHISQVFEPYSPVIKTDLLPDDPLILFNKGLDQNKPMILGSTVDEGMLFIEAVLSNPVQSQLAYNASARLMFHSNSEAVIEQYPPDCPKIVGPNNDCDERLAMNPVVTDYLFLCSQRKSIMSENRNQNKDANVWYYYFDQTWSFPEFWEEYETCYDKVCHCEELPYVFDMDTLTEYRFNDIEKNLAERLVKYWTNFAKYGDPNDPGNEIKISTKYLEEVELERWPKVFEKENSLDDTEYKALYIGGTGDYVLNNPKKDKCDFWDSIDFYLENRNMVDLTAGLEFMISINNDK